MSDKFTHLNDEGLPGMVDISEKNTSYRTAKAYAKVVLGKKLMQMINGGDIQTKKGGVFQTAIIAGTQGAKQTSNLIPFCHLLALEKCKIEITPINDEAIEIICTVKVSGKTGVEMEALSGVSITALTIYDMCKAINKAIIIEQIQLIEKTGGKSGDFKPVFKHE